MEEATETHHELERRSFAVMDRVVQKHKDEREAVQKKTFTKWLNSHLAPTGSRVTDLYTDLRDGKIILKLMELLSGDRLPRPTRGRMRIHCLENVDKGLKYIERFVQLENIGSSDIVDGNSDLTLGLIWTIILRWQVQIIIVRPQAENMATKSAKEALLLWCQLRTAGYKNVNITNFTTSWRDGLAFNALIHHHREELIEYDDLQKSQPIYNLNNAFNVAEQKLGLASLLDAEDVAVDIPDEKSIITYVVTYYHYFNKFRAETILARRIGKVIDVAVEGRKEGHIYEELISELLLWIRKTIDALDDRRFSNSVPGVQQQLGQFKAYRTVEKPPRYVEKGNLEMMLFAIESKLRSHELRLYVPPIGKRTADINQEWEHLERAEHERELALREELIRQEKLERLATRFHRKAAMREAWLSENQRLVAQDNFGTDLNSVDAVSKKHDAIESDIFAYEQRVQAVVDLAETLDSENFYDMPRINSRKANVLRLWHYLLELYRGRRQRLDVALQVHETFVEMLQVMMAMEDLKARLTSENYGRHLIEVEELIRKHELLYDEIVAIDHRVKAVNNTAKRFIDNDGTGLQPVDPNIVREHIRDVENIFADANFYEMYNGRKHLLDDSRKLWTFFGDVLEEENWIREKEHVVTSTDIGRDLTSINQLILKHKLLREDCKARTQHLNDVLALGDELIRDKHFALVKVQSRVHDVRTRWEKLLRNSDNRKTRLREALDFHQFFADVDDTDAWMLDMLRIVSSDDIGHEEDHVKSLIKKHDEVTENLLRYEPTIQALKDQANNLGEADRNCPEVRDRLSNVVHRYDELIRLAEVRRQRLLAALGFFQFLTDVDATEQLINEKERMLATMAPTQDIEEVEMLKHRFKSLENEVVHIGDRVKQIDDSANALLSSRHPDSQEIRSRRNRLNTAWNAFVDRVTAKRDELERSRGYYTFRIECQETTRWIEEKIDMLQGTEVIPGDLQSLMNLQRRLNIIERDMGPIHAKLDSMLQKADLLERERPEEAADIRDRVAIMNAKWDSLKALMCEKSCITAEARELQDFLRDLDLFQLWLTDTRRRIASEELHDDLDEIEKLIGQHKQLKEEIDRKAPEFQKLLETESHFGEFHHNPQFALYRVRIKEIKDGWDELGYIWKNRQLMMQQKSSHLIYLRNARECELLLTQQEIFLARDEMPRNLEEAEAKLKRHDQFVTTMDVNEEKVQQLVELSERLTSEGHHASPEIFNKTESIIRRFNTNRDKASLLSQKLRDARRLQQYLREVEEHIDFINNKRFHIEDENYHSAKTAHQKWMRHQAFEAEVVANRPKMDEIRAEGEVLIQELPLYFPEIRRALDEINARWQELEDVTRIKGQRLFDANRQAIYEQSCEDLFDWVTQLQTTLTTTIIDQDFMSINAELQNQLMLESELEKRRKQIEELRRYEQALQDLLPEKTAEFRRRRLLMEEQFLLLEQIIKDRRLNVDKRKIASEFVRDIDDHRFYINLKMAQATNPNVGQNLFDTLRIKKQHNNLRNEVTNYEPRVQATVNTGKKFVAERHPDTVRFQELLDDLTKRWRDLKDAVSDRDQRLDLAERAQQYFSDADEAQTWISEHELFLTVEDKARDETTAQANVAKQELIEHVIADYVVTIRKLSNSVHKLLKDGNPSATQVSMRQKEIEKEYDALKERAQERRVRVDQAMRLFMLQRDIRDFDAWIAEKHPIAATNELGTSFDHATILSERFDRFIEETETSGIERARRVNKEADDLLLADHPNSPLIAQWKDQINDDWGEFLELMRTRKALLAESFELQKLLWDCRELLGRIQEKKNSISEDVGRDTATVKAQQRKHAIIQQDLAAIAKQLEVLQIRAEELLKRYAGENAQEINDRQSEVVRAWQQLQRMVDARLKQLGDADDYFRLLNMIRNLMFWIDDVTRHMNTSEKAHDVSGVQMLISSHEALRSEINSRDGSILECIELGTQLLQQRHYASVEIRQKVEFLNNQVSVMNNRWEDRDEHLKLILQVYQFARDASLAEAWLIGQEPWFRQELGHSVSESEREIKKQEAFEKSLVAQEDRFRALGGLTALELRERSRRQEMAKQDDERRRHELLREADERRLHEEQERRHREEEEKKRQQQGKPQQKPETPKKPSGKPSEFELPTTPVIEARPSPSLKPPKKEKVPLAGQAPNGSGSIAGSDTASGRFPLPSPSSSLRQDDQEIYAQGPLERKHDIRAGGDKSSERSWVSLYAVIKGPRLYFYRDEKTFNHSQDRTYHGEAPLKLARCGVSRFNHHSKKHVFEIVLSDGAKYLCDAKNNEEVAIWMESIRGASNGNLSSVSRSGSLSSKISRNDSKRASLPFRKKKTPSSASVAKEALE